jgi:hypothetical protein
MFAPRWLLPPRFNGNFPNLREISSVSLCAHYAVLTW